MHYPRNTHLRRPPTWLMAASTLLLFLVWGNSFVALSFLLGSEVAPARLDFSSYTLARYPGSSSCCSCPPFLVHFFGLEQTRHRGELGRRP